MRLGRSVVWCALLPAAGLSAAGLSAACGNGAENKTSETNGGSTSTGATGNAGGNSNSGGTGASSSSDGGTSNPSGGTDASAGTNAGGDMGQGGDVTAGGLPGPLVVSDNPRYFKDQNGDALVLAGSHTWNNLQDWGADGQPQAFDFDAYAGFLVNHGQNFTLLWRTEFPKFCGLPTLASGSPDLTTDLQPWPRTGPGDADDGGLKFDLDQFDENFFDRLRERVSKLNDVGVWVGVYLLTGEWEIYYRCPGSDGYPLTGANNINGVDDGGGNGSMNMTSTNAVTDVQDALADKMVDTLNDLPNVLWIVSEEAGADTMWWQGHMIDHMRTYEATKPLQHPIGLGAVTGQPDSVLYDSDADWVAPFANLSPSTSCGSGNPACKVNINDSDHSYFGMWNNSAQQNRNYAWQNFARGNQVAFMDPYNVYYPREGRNPCPSPSHAMCTGPDTRWDNFRDNLGYIVTYSRKLNLVAAEPSTTLCSTQYCLGQTPATGAELLVYAPDGGGFTVDLSSATGRTMDFEWFDPATGDVVSTGSVAGGNAAESFSTPGEIAEDAVLYLVDSEGHAG